MNCCNDEKVASKSMTAMVDQVWSLVNDLELWNSETVVSFLFVIHVGLVTIFVVSHCVWKS